MIKISPMVLYLLYPTLDPTEYLLLNKSIIVRKAGTISDAKIKNVIDVIHQIIK